jgi:hypothetical protein
MLLRQAQVERSILSAGQLSHAVKAAGITGLQQIRI